MTTFIVFIHVIVCITLILIVLLQKGRGADMGAAFGGSSQALFGGAGPAQFLTKITTAGAVIFMLTSLSLAYISAKPTVGSIMKGVQTQEPVEQMPHETDKMPAEDAVPGAE